jgi:hypothetical protein
VPDQISAEDFAHALALTQALLRESQAESISWTEDEHARDSYWTSIANKVIEISSRDGDGRHPFQLTVADSPDAHLLQLDTSMESPSGVDESWPDIVRALYLEARKRGRTLNKALGQIMTELDRKQEQRDLPF